MSSTYWRPGIPDVRRLSVIPSVVTGRAEMTMKTTLGSDIALSMSSAASLWHSEVS